MDEHKPRRDLNPPAKPATETPRPFAALGACCGGLLFVMLGVAAHTTQGSSWTSEYLGKYVLLPAMVGALLGFTIGWAVRITRTQQDVGRTELILAWGLLGGWLALLPTYVIAVVGVFAGGWSLSPVGHGRAPGMAGVIEALLGGAVFLILFGLPVFAFGAIVGTVVALVKWSRKRNQKPPPDRGAS